MIWQDILMAVASVGFSLALLPSAFSAEKPHFWTGVLTSTCAAAMCLSQATLGLYIAAIATFINFVIWIILVVQTYEAPVQ